MRISAVLRGMVPGLALALAGSQAHAVPLSAGRDLGAKAPTSVLAEGAFTLAPLAHVKFCMRHGAECGAEPADRPVIGEGEIGLLSQVNRGVNRRIRPTAKSGAIGDWAVNPRTGDCNDYAVSKRHELVALGLPASALRLAVVRTGWGEGHLVLVARTARGDLVLDNLSGELRHWSSTRYDFLKIQSAVDPRRWVSPVAEASPSGPAESSSSGEDVFVL